MEKQKQLVKLADCILSAILKMREAKLEDVQAKFEIIKNQSASLAVDGHRLAISAKKGFHYASGKVIRKLSRDLNDLNYHLSRFRDLVANNDNKPPALSEIVSELVAMEKEFDEVDFDAIGKTISVTTRAIYLDDLSLGRFEIRLFIEEFDKLYKERPYKVIALEPNPAGSDCNVTHPHISHERLCEGDGHTAISKALEQARLVEFFTMVIAILENYNSESPYVAISDWEGSSCYDCGCGISAEETYYCEYCEHEYCAHCSGYCQICDTTLCLGCSFECPGCKEPVCHSCTGICGECGGKFCEDCLTDGLCKSCQKELEEHEDEENDEDIEQQNLCEVQPEGVVEAAVYAGYDGQ